MSYRGSLIHKFIAVVYPLDTYATDTGGGYDADFRTVKHQYPGKLGVRQTKRVEGTPYELICQIEVGRWGQQTQRNTGNAPNTSVELVCHFKDLEAAGLVDTVTGDPLIHVNDRVGRILHYRTRALIQEIHQPAGLYVTEVKDGEYTFGDKRNLCFVFCDDRRQGVVLGQ